MVLPRLVIYLHGDTGIVRSCQHNVVWIHQLYRPTQKIRGVHTMLFQCWVRGENGGPTSKKQWVNSIPALNN